MVRAGNGSDLEREFPFGVVRQLFDPLLATPGGSERLFAGAAAPARPVFEPASGEVASSGEDVSFAALHGLYWLALNLSATFYDAKNTTVTQAQISVFNCPSDQGVGTIYHTPAAKYPDRMKGS